MASLKQLSHPQKISGLSSMLDPSKRTFVFYFVKGAPATNNGVKNYYGCFGTVLAKNIVDFGQEITVGYLYGSLICKHDENVGYDR
jgi:hypothetical protein